MFLGKLYRKKRSLLLPCLPTAKKKLLMSWSRPVQDAASLERYWFQGTINNHNAFCGCGDANSHFSALARRYGYPQLQQPQQLLRSPSSIRSPNSIRRARALPAAPEQQPALPWHGGGGEGDAARGEGAGAGRDEPEYEPGDLDALFAAVEEE